MKRKIFSILFALALVLSFSLVTAVPVGASPATLEVNGPVAKLTTDAGHYLGSFSPDGSKIVCTGAGGIWVMNADGSDPQQIYPSGMRPKWGPDGLIALAGTGITIIQPDGTLVGTIGITQPYPPDPTRIETDTHSLDWSPDGSKIAFATTVGTSAIWTINLDGTGRTQITDYSLTAYSPAWSPDGTEIACAWGPSAGIVGVFVSDGSSTTPLRTIGTGGDYPDWGPNNKIAYHIQSTSELYVMDSDGSNDTKVFDGPAAMVAWSPDGKRIVYIDGFANKNIWTRGYPYTTIQSAINAADSGDTVNVAAGLYNERLTISESLDLRGARYGVDPTPSGARTTPADESIIDITGLSPPNPNVAVEIASGVSNVSVAGFTLIGSPTSHYADEAIVRCWNDGIAIEDNIMDGFVGVLYKESGTGLTVHRNRMVVNKNGVVIQVGASDATISNNVITLGSTPAGDESAIYMTGCSESSVTGNTATGFIHNAALAGSNLDHLTVSGNTFTGNAAGISIWGNSTFITVNNNNVLSDSLATDWGDSGCGISIKGQDIVITGNQITNNADIGVKIDYHVIDTVRVTISNNNIADNTNYGVWVNTTLVTETVNATNNWWGSINGPEHAGNTFNVGFQGGKVSDYVDYVPWYDTDMTGASFAPVTSEDGEFSSIQAAIDAATGTTITCAAGTYDENVVVDKFLTLQGEDREATIIQSQLEGGMYGTYGDRVVIIEADDVSVSGFTLSGYTSTEEKSGSTAWPLYADGYNNLEAIDNIFTFYTQGGIRFLDGDNLLIKDNIFQRETRSVWYDPPGVEPGSYADRTYGGMGPELWGCTNATIDPNVIETYAVGISIMGCDGVSIEDNIVSAPDTAMPSDSGIHIQTASNITVTGNTVSNFTAGEKEYYNDGTTGAGIRIISSNENVTIDGNQLSNNTVGVLVTGASGSPEIHRNNIEGNTEFGVLNCTSWIGEDQTYTPASVTIDATYNWWGHASGPSHELSNGKWVGKGDKVSDNVDYKAWLHKSKEKTVPTKKPSYAQSVVLDNYGEYGWNTFSAPIFLDDEANTWKKLYDLTDLAYSVAYRFDSDTQEFVELTIDDEYAINPGEGFFIKMDDVGSLTILYSTKVNLVPPSRPLTAGWNLIGLANLEDMDVDAAFPSIATVPGLAGYSQVVSPIGNAEPGPVLADGTIYVGESYWVYMLGARTLAGFTMTPVEWVP